MEVIVKIKWNKIKRLIKISKRELSIMKKNLPRKNLIVGGLFVKGTDGWWVRKIMKGAVAVTSIPSATTKRMLHYNKSCIVDCSPIFAILHHWTNDASTGYVLIYINQLIKMRKFF